MKSPITITDDQEAFPFKLSGVPANSSIDWYVDDKIIATTSSGNYLWPKSRGNHTAMAKVRTGARSKTLETSAVRFIVK